MKKLAILTSMGLILALGIGCSGDDRNKLARKKIEYLDGNYDVAVIGGPTYQVRDDKVTSSPKGYYFFWTKNKKYVQVPIALSVVEEVKEKK
jgi:hypothetical protein